MALGSESVPMRWPAGPLEIALRKDAKGFSAETADLLHAWLDPASLAVVQGTPVNCLVVSWASGLPEDAAQQQALKPLIEKGRQAGLDFAGIVEGKANRQAAVAAAESAGGAEAKKNPATTIAARPSTFTEVSAFWVYFPSRTPMMLINVRIATAAAA